MIHCVVAVVVSSGYSAVVDAAAVVVFAGVVFYVSQICIILTRSVNRLVSFSS